MERGEEVTPSCGEAGGGAQRRAEQGSFPQGGVQGKLPGALAATAAPALFTAFQLLAFTHLITAIT